MSFTVIDIDRFLDSGLFRQEAFLSKVEDYDWSEYADRKVLVRGCGSTIIPPWAYMAITGKLAGVARSVRFGNEHDHVVVYRRQSMTQKT